MTLKETYNKIARDWYKDHKTDTWWIEGTDTFVSLLKPHAAVLDIGCGAGVKSKYLHDKGLEVTGIDFSESFIEIAKEEVPNVAFHVLDMKDVGQLGKKFDGVFAQASLLHIPKNEIRKVLRELVGVLNPGGSLYFAVKGIRNGGPEEHVLEEKDYGYTYQRFFSYFTLDELVNYMKELDLEVVFKKSELVGNTDWLQVVARTKA